MGEIRIKRDNSDWDNRPAHQYVNGEWIDIPTHKYTNNRWQGELTSQSPLKFRADGEMLDWRIEGKTSENLFDINGEHMSNSRLGITCFVVDDNKLVVQIISPGGTTRITYPNNFYNPNVLYTVSVKLTGELTGIRFLSTSPFPGGTYNTTYRAYWKAMTLNNGIYTTTFAPTETATIGFVVIGADDARNPGTVENIQLLEGSYTTDTLPPYEPYGGVGDWDETTQRYKIPIQVEGENLFDIEHFVDTAYRHNVVLTQLDNGIRIQATSSSDPYVNYTYWVIGQVLPGSMRSAAIPCKPNTDYTLCCAQSSIVGKYISYFDKDYNVVKGHTMFSTELLNFKTPENCAYILLRIGDSSTLSEGTIVELTNIQIYEGAYTALTIPPYEVNLFTDHQLMDGDSIDFSTDQTTIPLAVGNNTLTVDTAVQPKSVFVKFEG